MQIRPLYFTHKCIVLVNHHIRRRRLYTFACEFPLAASAQRSSMPSGARLARRICVSEVRKTHVGVRSSASEALLMASTVIETVVDGGYTLMGVRGDLA